MKTDLINLGFYRFFPLGDMDAIKKFRLELTKLCKSLELKGTILLASEGINVMVAGSVISVEAFKEYAKTAFGMDPRDFKETVIAENSFHRMLVKIKKEIISVGDSDIKPYEKTAKRLSAKEYKKWMEEKKPMILLDTRNNYEVEVGTFEGAIQLDIETSRDFARKVAPHLKDWENTPVLTFCTGGIRCEKASAYLLKMGLQEVYQLDGGILRYFEENSSAHFQGSCFVFDWRLAVDGELRSVPRSENSAKEFGRHKKSAV